MNNTDAPHCLTTDADLFAAMDEQAEWAIELSLIHI